MSSLTTAFSVASPRPMPVASLLIHGFVIVLWVALFTRAFAFDGLFAWSIGIAYAGYDTFLLAFVAWQTLPLIRPSRAIDAAARRPTLGVVIAAHNEARSLPVTLAALLAQSDPPDEILIADDGSSDDTGQVLTNAFRLATPPSGEVSAPSPGHPGLRWLRLPHGGKARALNAAIVRLDTEIVLTVDADTLLAPDAIGAMRSAFGAEPELVGATGILIPTCRSGRAARFFQWFQTYEYIRSFVSRYAYMRADSLLLVSGAFAGFRRDALLAVGGFDPECLVEDYELIHRLHRTSIDHNLRWRVRVVGSARATTDAPGAVGSFLNQRRRWFGGFLQTQYWNRDMVGSSRYGLLGTLMLPIKAFDTMQPIYGLTAFGLLLVFAASGKATLAGLALAVIGVKIAIDLIAHLWTIHLYRRWTGDRSGSSIGYAVLAVFIEPFSFQLLRHTGAAWAWLSFLTRHQSWGANSRAVEDRGLKTSDPISR
ncbi:glycosyltransferase [Methylocapsa sp. S129]|uniref:glycosyltransferase family 2 protein n=1 Tax=Methylocapsa sp. S129 TaxID=1641869 RepID=UPI00131B62C9|nr:glycosyltransferase [Methylocapsa sp. S129]